MHIFVSGGTGVIGKRAVRLMIANGHRVTMLVRTAGIPERIPGVAHVVGGLFDRPALQEFVAGHDAVVNLATHMPSPSWKMIFRNAWRENDRIRTIGVANLAATAASAGIARFVQESFAMTYPDSGDRWIDETTPIAPAPYNATVIDAERSVASFAEQGGVGVTLRFAALYGPDADQTKSYIAGVNWGWAALPGTPDAFISSISHDDAASAVIAALALPGGTYNVCDDEPVRRDVYFASLADALGQRPPRFVPHWSTPLFGAVGETLARSLRISNRKLRDTSAWSPALADIRQGWAATISEI
jgi:nucleoside-diphosphate-sugar epimerase